MNILTKTARALGEMRAAYDAPLLKSLNVDGIGRTLPMGQGLPRWLGTAGDELSAAGYANHGTAYSIISYILATAAPLPWAVYALDTTDNRAKPQPKHPLAQLLYRPNPRQSWADFKIEAAGGLLLHGETFIRRVVPPFGSQRGKTTELYALPAPCVELLPVGGQLGRFDAPTGYRFTDPATGQWTDYPPDEILHLKTWNPANPARGLSPIAAGIDAVTAAKAGLESRVRQYQNQGPAGILYDETSTEAWSPEQAGTVRRWFNSFRLGGRRSGELPISSGKLGYLPLGLSPVDLDVLAAIPHDKDAIADLFHFPGQLLNGSKGTTFSNMGEAGAALYTRCVVPLETQLRDGLNRWLGPEYADAVFLDFDVSHIAELQPNKEKLAAWLGAAWWVSVPAKQAMMGVAVDWKGPEYMVPAGLVGADTLTALPTELV